MVVPADPYLSLTITMVLPRRARILISIFIGFQQKRLGTNMGVRTLNTTISFPTASGGKCPVGWKKKP